MSRIPHIELMEGDTLEENLEEASYGIPDELDVPLLVLEQLTLERAAIGARALCAAARERAAAERAGPSAKESAGEASTRALDDGGNQVTVGGYTLRARARGAIRMRD